MNNCEEYEKELHTRPKDYFGIIYDLMDEGLSSAMFTKHRDSEILEISNYETAKAALQKWIDRAGWDTDGVGNDYYNGAVSIESSSHWAVGWVETIHVKIRNRKGEFTKAFRVACSLVDRMNDYPVLDDEDYSRREYEDLYEWLETEVQDAEKCARWLFENYSVSHSDSVRYEWLEEWRKENEPDDN